MANMLLFYMQTEISTMFFMSVTFSINIVFVTHDDKKVSQDSKYKEEYSAKKPSRTVINKGPPQHNWHQNN